MVREPEGFSPKKRISITLDEKIYNYHKYQAKIKGVTFSKYVELILNRGD